jgi:aminoglycoside/choline kinase family phosphotransferase
VTHGAPAISDDVTGRIARFLYESGLGGPDAAIVPLTGDASDRRYFRVRRSNDSIVLALHAGPITFASLPFANVAGLLSRMPIPIPAILGYADPLGIVAQEDLGDVTLQAHLHAIQAGSIAPLYREAVEIIERLQRRGADLAAGDYLPYGLAFDVEKLTWELEFFAKHFLEGFRGIRQDAARRAALAAEFLTIAEELAGEPRVLCHRDYHSRNLMLHRGGLYVIDFQDARMGPDTYDLVSLLRDSYVDLEEELVGESIERFAAMNTRRPEPLDAFRRRFDLMAVQRNLKALGTFGYQASVRGNTSYVRYVARTLRHVRTNLIAYPRFATLRRLLAQDLEELR